MFTRKLTLAVMMLSVVVATSKPTDSSSAGERLMTHVGERMHVSEIMRAISCV
jgi:hypothetical protein